VVVLDTVTPLKQLYELLQLIQYLTSTVTGVNNAMKMLGAVLKILGWGQCQKVDLFFTCRSQNTRHILLNDPL